MESYGTFGMDTMHGRLFELQVFVDSLKMHTMMYFLFVIVALLIWPIAALLALPLSYIAGKDKELQICKVLFVLATVFGALLWMCPLLIVGTGGGLQHFYDLIKKGEMNFLDFVDFFLSELMILLAVVFAWVYHEITLDTGRYKQAAVESWRQRHDEYGLDIHFATSQFKRLINVLEESGGEKSRRDKEYEGGGSIFIEDIVQILETLPGWASVADDETVNDHYADLTGEESGLFASLASLTDEARQKSIWPIDIWLVREQWTPKNELDMKVGILVALRNTKDLVRTVYDYITTNSVWTFLVICLAAARALLPRLWLWLVLKGTFWPTDPFGPASRLVLYSTILSFTVSLVWISLFWFILMEYRRNTVQVMIISSLVDARMRVKWSQYYLMSCMWFGLTSEESEDVLQKMPLFDMRISSNVAAFWRLREYCTLDRANERMAMSVLLEIVIIWLLLKFAATLAIMFAHGGLPAIICVTLFDLCVFGFFILFALNCALAMNGLMEEHKKVFVEAKYEVTMAHGGGVYGGRELGMETTKSLAARRGIADGTFGHSHEADLELSRRLLTEYLDMSNEYDTRDCILFGMTVTPGKIMSSAASFAIMIYTIMQKMVSNGTIDVEDHVEEQMGTTALLAAHVTSNFLSKFLRPVHLHAA